MLLRSTNPGRRFVANAVNSLAADRLLVRGQPYDADPGTRDGPQGERRILLVRTPVLPRQVENVFHRPPSDPIHAMQPRRPSVGIQLKPPRKPQSVGRVVHLAALPRRGGVRVRPRLRAGLHDTAEQRACRVEGHLASGELCASRNEVAGGVEESTDRTALYVVDWKKERAGDELGLLRGRDDAAAAPRQVEDRDLLVIRLVRRGRRVQLFMEAGRWSGLDPVVWCHAPLRERAVPEAEVSRWRALVFQMAILVVPHVRDDALLREVAQDVCHRARAQCARLHRGPLSPGLQDGVEVPGRAKRMTVFLVGLDAEALCGVLEGFGRHTFHALWRPDLRHAIRLVLRGDVAELEHDALAGGILGEMYCVPPAGFDHPDVFVAQLETLSVENCSN